MRKHVMRLMMTAFLMAGVMPFVNAQVNVGDILCEGNKVVNPQDYDSKTGDAIGVVFYVDASKHHGWAVGLNDIAKDQWGPNWIDTPLRNSKNKLQVVNDLDGYSNTKVIYEGGYDVAFPAFQALDFQSGWYLPAIGQLKRLYANLDKVDESLSAVGGSPLSDTEDWEYWSSTESYICDAWSMDSNGKLYSNDESYNGNKDDRKLIRGVKNF